jgi:hypothetical protein
MLRSLREIIGYSIVTEDGEIGTVHDLLFDDALWCIRYLVVDTGTWLRGRLVLISNRALCQPQWQERTFPVALTRQQVADSPPLSDDRPVSRQHEIEIHRHYGWPTFWAAPVDPSGVAADALAAPTRVEVEATVPPEVDDDPHLRGINEVRKYRIEAADARAGHVEDFIADDDSWLIRYIVVDTRSWLPGKSVLVSPRWFRSFDWHGQVAHIELDTTTLKGMPEYHAGMPVNREVEEHLYDFLGRPRYWES